MEELSRVKNWLETGKQVGKTCSLIENEKTYWVSVAVQKWQGEYKLYVDKTEETRMGNFEDYETEQTAKTKHFEEIQQLLNGMCSVGLHELTPQKGQKIFNPEIN
ncbi:hypothetical protein D0N36_07900 [Hymenobacter lapidiphilus]|uniref:hypothetical protein n=1 Tax=Hymenobacter sp. CCM 8763 TaxID=2303334 RepID=UPI000E34B116|nr:hypothetical protein [Hymenobacter sp. CCM 8763]RFP65611.1 hypothetical protein D0N36_07900 [Hymenobacter sp. CCM 8763]